MRNVLRLAVLTLVATTTGCGTASSDDQAASGHSEGTVRDELINQQPVTIDDWSGIVSVQRSDDQGNFTTRCIGVLWTNNTALAYASCGADAERVVAGNQIGIVSKRFTVGGVTMLRFNGAFQVWNSNKTSHPATGYARPIWTGTDADLGGRTARVLSLPGNGTPGTTTATGNLHWTPDDINGPGHGDISVTSNGNSILTILDQGALCFDSTSTNYVGAHLDAIVQPCNSLASADCRAMGAEQWYPTMGLMLYSGW